MDNLIRTRYTHSYPINPHRAWCTGCPNISIPYGINLGQLLAVVPDQPRTSLDILLTPIKYQSIFGVFNVQIPRWALDSKDSLGTDIPFRVTMNGNVLHWSELGSKIIEYWDCILLPRCPAGNLWDPKRKIRQMKKQNYLVID